MNKKRYNEEDFEGFLVQLIESGRHNRTEEGITKYMMDNGYDSLSAKQKYLFDQMIDNNSVDECERSACNTP